MLCFNVLRDMTQSAPCLTMFHFRIFVGSYCPYNGFVDWLAAGRTVVFGTDSGVCVRGHVILRHDVIADNWVTVSLFFWYCSNNSNTKDNNYDAVVMEFVMEFTWSMFWM